jgi:hypothetical protein
VPGHGATVISPFIARLIASFKLPVSFDPG